MRRTLSILATVAMFASVAAMGPAYAGSAIIEIDQVGGRQVRDAEVRGTLFGKTLVEGVAVPGSAAPTEPVARPLVADAGDSGFAPAGTTVTLLGSGFGGTEPYAFSWTTTGGTLDGADSATAQVDTAGLAGGTYTATLTITDSTGATASDDVRFVVFVAEERTLLDETQLEPTPGVLGVGAPGVVEFPFTVPENTVSMTIDLTWQVELNDYDMRVLDPSGTEVTGSAGGVPQTSESAGVSAPVAGVWTVAVDKFLVAGDELRVVVGAQVGPADPRPSVESGGPYRFGLDDTQTISGSVTGGTAPVSAGWDTDENGLLDTSGTSFTGDFDEGRRLITLKATDANGLERRETTSVLVASQERLAAETTAITVIAINDTGVNPYHVEFSAETYPDPDVLALTDNFQKHPSEYIPGYPSDAQAIRATFGQGYFPEADRDLWDLRSPDSPNGLEFGKLYWIPGTKIVGAIQPGTFSCANCTAGAHVILDDDGHGSGSTSVSTGNRYGYCPTCLLVISKGLSSAMRVSSALDWVDIQSNSWGTIANLPLDLGLQLVGLDPGAVTREAVERGQTVLFASGNGSANAFESTSPTYGTSTTGPDWNVVVGALRRDNERAIVGDGTPAHLSAWGDGNLPSACRTGVVSQCAFSGTSAATPYTSGIFGTVLTAIRQQIGDGGAGQRPGQVIADGFAIPGNPYLGDGKLTRAELREAVLKTAFPLNQDNTQQIPIFPYPWTAPYNGEINVLFEGYGAATPNSAKRAIDVLLGKTPMPTREAEDSFFRIDRQIRDSLWGGYDRDADGTTDSEAALGQFGLAEADVVSAEATWATMQKVVQLSAPEVPQTLGVSGSRYYLHRLFESEPGATESCASNVTFMDADDTSGDKELCFDSRITSVVAAFRPLAMYPTTTDTDIAIPAGSDVFVELYAAGETPSAYRPTGVLMATDRVLGTGAAAPQPVLGSGPGGALCETMGELCWTKFTWQFQTTRHAIAGEQITFQVQLIGARSWAFGYEGSHASRITIIAAPIPSELEWGASFAEPADGASVPDQTPFSASGFVTFPALGTTEAGDHPTAKRVDVSVDDPGFGSPIQATLTLNDEETSGSWSAPIPGLAPGTHTLYAKARQGDIDSEITSVTITVEDINTTPRVQWQIVPAGTAPASDGWTAANGVLEYSFEFDTRDYGKGTFDIYTRLLEGGAQTAITSVRAKFRG
ncbi:MAG: S8 family serine peptidase [Candidatus Limnocylindria bacterium]